MKKIIWIFAGVLLTQTACDLQPKILSFPDSVGEFISARYPALLADPNVNPEIYNSAATDYGVYAAPDLNAYGKLSNDEYVIYASVNDYAMPAQDVAGVDAGAEIVAPSCTVIVIISPSIIKLSKRLFLGISQYICKRLCHHFNSFA